MGLGECGQKEGDRTARRLQLESEGQRQLKELALASGLQADDSRGHSKVTICRSWRSVVGQGRACMRCCRSAVLWVAAQVARGMEWAAGESAHLRKGRPQLQVTAVMQECRLEI